MELLVLSILVVAVILSDANGEWRGRDKQIQHYIKMNKLLSSEYTFSHTDGEGHVWRLSVKATQDPY